MCPRRISRHDTRDVYRRRWGKLLRRATSVVGLFSNALLVKAHDLHWRYNTPTTIHGHSPLVELSWTAEYPVSRSVRAFSALIFASISSVRVPASSEVVCPKTSSRNVLRSAAGGMGQSGRYASPVRSDELAESMRAKWLENAWLPHDVRRRRAPLSHGSILFNAVFRDSESNAVTAATMFSYAVGEMLGQNVNEFGEELVLSGD